LSISLFKETFEAQPPFTKEEGTSVVPESELVLVCLEWMRYCDHKLLDLALKNHSFYDVNSYGLEQGELARNAGVQQLVR
jgi:hypothetical protein